MKDTVYLDLETTGLNSITDEIVEIAIIDDAGQPLINTLVKPVRHDQWPNAQAIHGISPAMVQDAPLFIDLREDVMAVVEGKVVVIYNAEFDQGFLGNLLNKAAAIKCCMLAFSNYINEPHYNGGVKWQSLATATYYIGYTWPHNAHRALADCQACRAVWHYLSEDSQIKRDKERKARAVENKAHMELIYLEHDAKARKARLEHYITAFLDKWWLKKYEPHWSKKSRSEVAEQFAQIFFGKSLALIELENLFEGHVYTSKKAIPEDLKPISYFGDRAWLKAELKPVAAFVGKKQGWPLYPRSEFERVKREFKLRFASADNTVTRTELKKQGYTDHQINAMEPVAERQNQHNFSWYKLYPIPF